MSQTITYQVKNAVYANITNRCPCACSFCLRNNGATIFGSPDLWLEREPTLEELEESLEMWDWTRYGELVFCGYGEPTERLDTLLAASAFMKERHPHVRIRVNTNGLGDLINGRSTAPLFAGKVDALSISLNTDDPEEYFRLCAPKFGPSSHAAMLKFAREAKEFVPDVAMTIVGPPVCDDVKIARARALCDSLGVRLRVRPYEG